MRTLSVKVNDAYLKDNSFFKVFFIYIARHLRLTENKIDAWGILDEEKLAHSIVVSAGLI